MMRLLCAPAPQRAALGVGLTTFAAALCFITPPAVDPLARSALGPFVAIAALLGRRAGGLAALAVAVLVIVFNAENLDAFDLTLFVAKWLAVVIVAGFVHDLWLGAAEQDRLRADELAQERRRLALAVEAGAVGVGALDFLSGAATLSDKWREVWGIGAGETVTIDALDAMVVEADRPARKQAQARSRDPRGSGLYQARFRINRGNDGAVRWVSSRGQVHFEDGRSVGMLGTTRDVTDEMEATAALVEKARLAELDRIRADVLAREQQRLALALEAGAIGTFEVDLGAHTLRLSEKHREIVGWANDRPMPTDTLDSMVVAEDLAALRDARARALAPGGTGRYRARFGIRRASDGALRQVDTRGQVSFDDGVPVRVFGVTRDVTDEMLATAALEERAKLAEQDRIRADVLAREQQRLALAMEAGAIGFGEFDLVSGAVALSDKWLEICGIAGAGPMTLDRLHALVCEDNRAAFLEGREAALDPRGSGLYQSRFRIRRETDGALRWITSRGQVVFENGVATRMFGVSRDITDEMEAASALAERARLAEQDRLRAEELARERQRLALALEAGAIGTYEINLLRGDARLSEKHREILGWLRDQPITLAVFDALVVEEDLPALQEARARSMSGDGRFRARFRFRRASDGALRHIDSHGQVVFDGDAPTRVFGVSRDVTDEMEAAAALEERASLAERDRLRAEKRARERQRLALALEAGAIGAFDADLVRNEIRFSEQLREIWGFSGNSPVSSDDLDALVFDEDRAARDEARERARIEEGRYRVRFRIRRADDGAPRWLDTRGHAYFAGGAAVRVLGVTRDITDEMQAAAVLEEKAALAEQARIRAEELGLERQRLRLERQRLELALEAGAIGTFEADLPDGKPAGNVKWREIMGFAEDAPVTARSVDALVIEQDRAARQAAQRRALDPGSGGYFACRYRIRRARDGALRWIDSRGLMYFQGDEPIHVRGVNRDITDEVQSAAALEERARLAEQLTLLAEALPGAVYSYVLAANGERSFAYVSSNVQKLLGFGPALDQLDLTQLSARVPPDDLGALLEGRALSQRDLRPWRGTFRYDHPKKGEIWIAGDSQPARREDGATVWHGYLQDVTARETAARALAESESRVLALRDERLAALEDKARLAEQLTLLASALPGAIYSLVIRPEGRGSLAYAAPQIETLLGIDAETCMRDTAAVAARVHRDDMRGLSASGAGSARSLSLWQTKFRYLHPGQGEIWLEAHAQPARREDGATVWHGYLQDVTVRERNAHALAESEARVRALRDERLAVLERMAAQLAHEVNQPLAAGATMLAVVRRRLDHVAGVRAPGFEGVAEALDKAADQMVRAGRIISRVREFSLHGEPDKTFRSLHDTIREALALLEADASFADFEIRTRLEASRDRVLIDRVQLTAVLMNLLRNARQASTPAGPRVIAVSSRNQDGNIEISVIDYGSGLSENARRHMFELFWTTKRSGMGVGLATSRAILEAHYGTIGSLEGAEGETNFTFSLPLVGNGEGPGDWE